MRDKDTGPDSTCPVPVRYATQAEWEEVKAQIEADAKAGAEAKAEALEGVRRLMADPDPKFLPLQEARAAEYERDIDGVAARLARLIERQAKDLRARFHVIVSSPDWEEAP
jgi:hypothetical protein